MNIMRIHYSKKKR